MKTDPETLLECPLVQEAYDDFIWSLIPKENRDTYCSIPSTTDAHRTLQAYINDRIAELADTPAPPPCDISAAKEARSMGAM